MHELLHFMGICPDHSMHANLLDVVVANYDGLRYITSINFNLIKSYVTQRVSSRDLS